MNAATVTFGKSFTGDRDSKTCDVSVDGVVVGYIEREYDAGAFQGAATFARTRRYVGTRLVLFDIEEEFDFPFGRFDMAAATKAAKTKAADLFAK